MHQLNSSEFTHSFSHLSKESLIIILQDSLKQQQSLKLQLLVFQEQLYDSQQQLQILKSKTSTQNDTCLIMMYTQQRNVDKIQRLEKAINNFNIKHKENIPFKNKESQWQSKYRQLERHLDLYIGNSNKVQEELLQGCRKMKRQNARVYKQYEKQAYLSQQFRLRCTALEITVREKQDEIKQITQQCQQYRKQIQIERNEIQQQRKQMKEQMQRQRQNLKQKEISRKKQNQKKQIEYPQKQQYMLIKQYKQSTQRYSKLQQQLRSLEFRYSGLSKQRDILNNQMIDAKQKCEQQKHQNHLLKQTIAKLQQYNKGLLQRLIQPPSVSVSGSVTQRGLVETWSVQVKRLKKQIEDLQKKYISLRDENKRMVNDKMLLDQKVRVIENTNQELLKQNLVLSSELRMERNKLDMKGNCRTNPMFKQEDTEGESTIITSVEMNWGDSYARKTTNFLSHGFTK